MNSFIEYVVYELKNSISLLILAGFLAIFVITISYIIFRKKSPDNHAFPWKRIFSVLLFVGYLLVILYATLLRGHSSSYRQFNIHLFRAWREAWNNFSVKNWANILLNIAMFVPLGVLLPVLWKQGR